MASHATDATQSTLSHSSSWSLLSNDDDEIALGKLEEDCDRRQLILNR